MTQLQQESSGSGAGAVVATVGCSVLGMMLAGPVGAVIGGTLAIAATASTAHRARHTRMELNISSISMPQDGITRQQGVTYFALDVVDTKGATWRVLRRYNHFDRFRKTLRRCGLRKPFPGRQVKGCGFGARLRERRLGLETWTREVVRIYSASGVPGRLESEFNDFFTRGRGQVTMVNQLGDQALPEGLGDIIFIATLTTLRTLLSIAVPPGVLPGQTLAVKVPDGRELHVVVPKDAGQELQLELDAASGTLSVLGAGSAPDTSSGSDDIFQIHVPSGVQPGQMVNIQVPDGRHLPFTVLMSALGFVPDEVLVYILQAHDARGAARQIARRCRKLVDANFNVRYIRPPAGKFFIVDFEVNDNLAKDLYCAQVGERFHDGSSMTGLVTFLHWLPAFCRSRVQRDVCHSLQESDGCALWKLISKVREHRDETTIPTDASMNSKVGHLTVSEGGGDARQVGDGTAWFLELLSKAKARRTGRPFQRAATWQRQPCGAKAIGPTGAGAARAEGRAARAAPAERAMERRPPAQLQLLRRIVNQSSNQEIGFAPPVETTSLPEIGIARCAPEVVADAVSLDDMAAMMAMMMMMGGAGGYGKGSGKGVFGDTKQMVQVSGLQGKVAWQDLKDHMKQAGRVEYCSILSEDGTEWGTSKDQACVRFASPQEALAAVQLMNGTPFKDIVLQVEPWPAGNLVAGMLCHWSALHLGDADAPQPASGSSVTSGVGSILNCTRPDRPILCLTAIFRPAGATTRPIETEVVAGMSCEIHGIKPDATGCATHSLICSRRIRKALISEVPRGFPRPYWLILSGKVHGKSCQKFMQVLHDTSADPISPWAQLVKVAVVFACRMDTWDARNVLRPAWLCTDAGWQKCCHQLYDLTRPGPAGSEMADFISSLDWRNLAAGHFSCCYT
eukprot:s632_g17.t1